MIDTAEYHVRLDEPLAAAMREIARRQERPQRAVVEEAVRLYILADTADRTDATMAPLIHSILQDQHIHLGKGLRTLMVRVGHEIMRTQYVLYNFMVMAGMSEAQVERWREDGWHFATKEFKLKPGEGGENPTVGDA